MHANLISSAKIMMVRKFLSLSLLLSCFIRVNCIPEPISTQCQNRTEHTCLTLSQLAERVSYYLKNDTTFILEQGNHSLNSELSIVNANEVFINGSGPLFSIIINCENGGRLSFKSVNAVYVTNLNFINCGSHQIKLGNIVVLLNSVFQNHREVAINISNSSVNITNTSFISNICTYPDRCNHGAAMIISASNVTINESTFEENCAKVGMIFAELRSNITIVQSSFACNKAEKGGVIVSHHSNITILASTFINNTAIHAGAVLYLDTRSMVQAESVLLENNKAAQGMVYLVESTCIFTGSTVLSNNIGSLLMYYSNVTLSGNTTFIMNRVDVPIDHDEGGAITAIRSSIFFNGISNIMDNKGVFGGAIQTLASEVHIYGQVTISNNNATEFGGGIYIFLSTLTCETGCILNISGNTAEKGGGVYAVTSLLTGLYGSEIKLIGNVANMHGGGIYLEVSAKLNILIIRENMGQLHVDDQHETFTFIDNLAGSKGGAVYVADETYFGTCNATNKRSTASECFLQAIILNGGTDEYESDATLTGDPSKSSVKFENNYAQHQGSNLFGGLLDRCTLSPFTESRYWRSRKLEANYAISYFEYLSNTSDLDTVNSDAVRICFCKDGELNCSYHPPPLTVKKGETFTLSLATVDQTNHAVSAAVYILLPESLEKVENTNLDTGNHCTNLNLSLNSPVDKIKLTLYANGPCKDATFSRTNISIQFSNCTCPSGFQPKGPKAGTKCMCECDTKLTRYVDIRECNNETQTLVRYTNSWINFKYGSDDSFSGYLIHRHCPLSHCRSSTPFSINISTASGFDAQCALHRTGVLCGTCETDFSISLSSSNCIACPTYWPAIFVGISLFFFLSGIALVALTLVLNITVAVGTLNGIIFYANIIGANSHTFLRFSTPNYATVFISWLNLDFGFDVCFIKGLDAYWKVWLELAFPTYVIFLVVMVIIISQRSKRFSQLIGRKNPVATLSTLIFLSYAKFLKIIVSGLSCTTLLFSGHDGEHYQTPYVWLSDATLSCYTGRHLVLFIIAVFILLVCIIYTITLFSWQWLLSLHNKCFSGRTWTWSLKLSMFIETSLAPYNPRNRYWTGLLLFIRVILYIASTANVSNNPRVDILTIGVVMMIIILFHEIISVRSRVYKKWPLELLEITCFVNLTLFSFATLFAQENEKATLSIAYTSVTITLCLFLGVLLYHFYAEVISDSKQWTKMKNCVAGLRPNEESLEGDYTAELTERHTRTTSVLVRSENDDHDFFYYNLGSDLESTY